VSQLSKANVQEIIDLSPLQETMLPQGSAGGKSSGHITQVRYTCEGVIDPVQFQKAWDHVIELYPELRVIFRRLRNRAHQIVLKNRPIPIELHDLREKTVAAQRAAIETTSRAHRKQFHLDDGPLMRLAVLLIDDRRSVFLWTYHQIFLDDYSRRHVLSDVLSIYRSITRDGPMPQIYRRPFREYLDWLARQDWTPAEEFWTKQLADLETSGSLIVGPSLAGQGGEQQASRRILLSEDLSQALELVSKRHAVSRSVLVQAMWAILLSLYSREDRVVFRLRCPGRAAAFPQVRDMIGAFASVVPVQFYVDGNERLPHLLGIVQEQSQALANYAYLPPHDVGEYVGLLPVLMVSDDGLPDAEASGKWVRDGSTLQVEDEHIVRERADYLAIDVTLGKRVRVAISYPRRIAQANVLARLPDHFCTLLESIARDPEAKLSALDIVAPTERRKLTIDFNRSKSGPTLDRLAHQVIEDQVAQRPEAVAAVAGDERITYRDLNVRANQLAHWLRVQGLDRDDLAAVLARRGVDMLVAILAILKAGGAYVPLDPSYPDARLRTLLSPRVKVIITEGRWAERSRSLLDGLPSTPQILCLGLDRSFGEVHLPGSTSWSTFPREDPTPVNQPDDLANVFYTSGSTGLPKGAMIEHVGMLNHLWAKVQVLGLTSESVVVQNASHCFDISIWQFLAPLMVGGKVVIYDNAVASDPQALLAAVRQDRASVLELVPTMLDMLLDTAAELPPAERSLPELRYLISTGEILPVSLCRRWLQTYPHIAMINAYGATECSDDTAHEIITVPPALDQSYLSVGRPIPNFKVYVLDRWHRPLPTGWTGEICLAGIGVGRGYLDDPERTAAIFTPNPFTEGMDGRMYRTGDLGRFLPDGQLVCLGRLDRQVKVRGHRIELGEIEVALLQHAVVQQAAVITRRDSREQNILVAHVVLDGKAETTDLRRHLQTLLPDYMLPEHTVQLDSLPLDRNGKVDRQALLHLAIDTPCATSLARPTNAVEEGLASIWQEVLQVPDIGIDDTFFELGGHSLKVIQVRSRIRQRFGIDVDLRTLFEYPTIRGLAPIINEPNPSVPVPSLWKISRLSPADYYPSSHAQRRLWFLQRLAPDSCFYNMPAALELEGSLDMIALTQAFQVIVDRHATLRTTLPMVEGQLVQHVAPSRTLPHALVDLSDLGSEAQQHALSDLIAVESRMKFDLEVGPLFRTRIVRLGHERHILVLNMHHTIGDAWSWQVLAREFSALYQAFHCQLPDPLPSLPIQYADYAAWQNERLTRGQLAEHERYWIAQLGGQLPLLDLPVDHPRPPVQTYNGRTEHMVLDQGLVDGLNRLCNESGATLFMVLLAAVGVFLSRMTGQEDLIIGTPVAGRDRVELEHLIGLFVNTLPLRLNVVGDLGFLEFLDLVKKTALDAYAHQEYPFDELVDRIKPVRDLSHPPVFSVMFQVNRALPGIVVEGLKVLPYPIHGEHARFDLTITFIEMSNGLQCDIEYNTDLFETSTIRQMLRHLQVLLQGIVRHPDRRITSLPLLSDDERHQLLVEWNRTDIDYPSTQCLHQLFEAQVAKTPDATAVVFENEQLTYQQLNWRANQMACRLSEMGVGPEVLVGICMERSLEMVVGLLGILKAGGAYVPLDPRYPMARLAFMIENTQMRVIVTQRALVQRLPSCRAKVICLDTDEESTENSYSLANRIAADNPAYVIYTSGSTGQPKGVEIPHRAVVNFLRSMQDRPGLSGQDTLLSVTTLSFDIAALEIFLPLVVGARLVLVSRDVATDGFRLARSLETSGCTVLQATPSTWRLLVAAGWQNDGRFKMLCGGETLSLDLATQLLSERASLWNLYGPTETTIWSTSYRVRSEGGEQISIGRPIANTQVYILDPHLEPTPVGVRGELYIAGDGLARGYLNRPELTANNFIPNPFGDESNMRLYRTGDLARYLVDGNIQCLGRIDHQVKIRGFRVELGEVEAGLEAHPTVEQAAAVAMADGAGHKQLVAYVVASDKQEVAINELYSHLKGILPEYMLPSAVMILDELPLTPNGKVDRKALPAPTGTREHLDGSYVAPRDRVELAMASLWEDALQFRPVGVSDDFFALGGHSLTAVALMGAIRDRFGVDLPLAVLFQSPTVAALCQHIQTETVVPTGCLVSLQQGSAGPPLFLVHPQGGGALCYLHLVRALDRETAIYGLQAAGYDVDEAPLWTIEAMADRYVEEIRRMTAGGPYRLAGWSFGGLVAFEMARRLEALHERVAFLGIFDTHVPHNEDEVRVTNQSAAGRALVDIATRHLGIDRSAMEDMDEEQGMALVLRRAQELNVLPETATTSTVRRHVRVMVASQVALDAYLCSGKVQTDIQLFRASCPVGGERPHPLVDAAEWRDRTEGRVRVVSIPADHYNLVNPPHAHELATGIKMILGES